MSLHEPYSLTRPHPPERCGVCGGWYTPYSPSHKTVMGHAPVALLEASPYN